MMRRRRPLLRGAMVAGAGYAAGKSRARSQVREADQEARLEALEAQQAGGQVPPPAQAPAPPPATPPPAQAPAPPPAADAESDRVDQLVKLKELLDSGVLTQQEFEAEKARILERD